MAPSIRALVVLAALSVASCAVEVGPPSHEVVYDSGSPGEPIYVSESPPPPRQEVVVGVAPGPSHIWVGGYWGRRPSGWVWIPGRWAPRPRPDVVWVPGQWERHPRGYVWVSGHWR